MINWFIIYKLNCNTNFSSPFLIFYFVTTKEGLFTNLPREMTLEILERLPIRSIITCKYVCKAWRVIIEGGGSPSCIRKLLVTFDLHGPCSRTLHNRRVLHRSYNRLYFVEQFDHLYVVNGMAYEFIKVPLPRRKPKLIKIVRSIYECKISRKYKIVYGYLESGCWSYYVYTLGGTGGRGVWRRIEGAPDNPTRPAESLLNGFWHMT